MPIINYIASPKNKMIFKFYITRVMAMCLPKSIGT